MYRSTGRPLPSPDEGGDEGQLRRFGKPVAFLPDPPAAWTRTLGQGGADGYPWSLDVKYQARRVPQVIVRTIRELPETVRVRPLDDLASPLAVFLNERAVQDGEAPLARHQRLPDLVRECRAVEESPAVLSVDGHEAEAIEIRLSGCFAVRARLAEVTVIVCGEDNYRSSEVVLRVAQREV